MKVIARRGGTSFLHWTYQGRRRYWKTIFFMQIFSAKRGVCPSPPRGPFALRTKKLAMAVHITSYPWKTGRFPYSFQRIPRGLLGAWIAGNPHTTRPLIKWLYNLDVNRDPLIHGPNVLTTRPRISTVPPSICSDVPLSDTDLENYT
jgi:hypothetical protein